MIFYSFALQRFSPKVSEMKKKRFRRKHHLTIDTLPASSIALIETEVPLPPPPVMLSNLKVYVKPSLAVPHAIRWFLD